jgi:hypothetical protein
VSIQDDIAMGMMVVAVADRGGPGKWGFTTRVSTLPFFFIGFFFLRLLVLLRLGPWQGFNGNEIGGLCVFVVYMNVLDICGSIVRGLLDGPCAAKQVRR